MYRFNGKIRLTQTRRPHNSHYTTEALFWWDDVENLGELKRLELVLATLPDELFKDGEEFSEAA